MKLSIAFTLYLFSFLSYAGGDHFPVFIKSIDISDNKFSFVAEPNVVKREWMDAECKSIKVSGTYDRLKWLRYSAPMSQDSHKKALEALLLAKNSGSLIYFGYIGAGLIKEANCNYKSKGLMYENTMVYSIYHSI
ncbi:hypothetical protein [Colwellia sp. UCD-KL20]|uniref:hypothetical protein n=1 Tax=Colwellia sp. UCD-KL20 TaxID=1917165 RepID=UPI00097092F2|nr:hypothetical protein [Colwellia sp. UCD-KL20]